MDVLDLPVAVVEIGPDRRFLAANKRAQALCGYEDLAGRGIDAVQPRLENGSAVTPDLWMTDDTPDVTHPMREHDVVLRCQDGTFIEVLIDGAYRLGPEKQLIHAVMIVRPKYEGPRRPSSGVRIVSAVSHELRSPLTSIRGYTALLLKRWDAVDNDDRHAMLGQVDKDARRVSRLINELLDISRIESGRVQLNRTEFDIETVYEEVKTAVHLAYPDLEVSSAFPPDKVVVWADRDKVIQVFTNLIENACKYASPKGIVVSSFIADKTLVVEVQDQGPGIPAEDLPHLFQQFFRSNIGRPSGTGLGLWISRGLIEAHGGTLTARSDGGHGTTFAFSLPLDSFSLLHGDD